MRNFTLEGHAIVSKNGMIADLEGNIPKFLQRDADWRQFQQALDQADYVALGRKSHEKFPNQNRKRIIITNQNIENEGLNHFWNPKSTPFHFKGKIAVAGVFDVFLALGFDKFILSQVEDQFKGMPCFNSGNPHAVLTKAGLKIKQTKELEKGLITYFYEKVS